MRRHRKFRGTWLPFTGEYRQSQGDLHDVVPLRFALSGPSGPVANYPTFITSLVYDVPQYDDAEVPTNEGLGDIIGNEYALRRIVGKIHLYRTVHQTDGEFDDPDNGQPLLVVAGIFIARAQDAAGDPDIPIGASGEASVDSTTRNNFSPLDLGNGREPWIWRRSWILGNNYSVSTAALNRGLGFFAASNSFGPGSALDSAHIDAKTRRTVRQEERLFFALSFCEAQANEGSLEGETVRGILELRAFGQLRKARQRGTF